VHGDFTMLLEDDERVYAFTRRHAGTELLVVANFSGGPVTAAVPGAAAWAGAELVLGNAGAVGRAEPQGLALAPWEARVYRRAA
jgi:oligo-1,6-glucosidase